MNENRIKEFRDRMGISQTELARRIKMASQNLSNIERGKLAPWPRIKKSLAKALKCSESELFPENLAKEEENG